LANRGHYLGSHISLNVENTVENAYFEYECSSYDRRSVRLSVTERGLEVCAQIAPMHEQHISKLADVPLVDEFAVMNAMLM